MSRSSPDRDTGLVGSTPDSPVKRTNLTGPPDTPATPSPSKDKVRAKRIERPSPAADEEESTTASPTKKSRTTVNRGKGKEKAVISLDADDNPFIAGTSNKEAVFIGSNWNFKRTIQWSFTGNWLVNPARASPKNFSTSLPGYTRPVITFNGNPVVNFTLGLWSLILRGDSGVLGHDDLMLGSFKKAEGYMSFNTVPAKISDESQSRPSYSRKSFVDLTKVVKSPIKDKVSSLSASKHPKSRSRPAEISSSQVAVSSNQKIPIWDARHYFEQQEAPVFDIETIAANCPIVEKEPAHHSVVAVLHTVSTYGHVGEPTNLSLNVAGVVILVGNEARGN
ncbi:hypothetical protein EVJ58_g956 [Rhodofomes roseus]|uniref:Uncharacterized protein n=1 Tax=Rhodofomes roseus TaxID=34475 RepID=A0A4Y9Z3E7_9APHY|nr:hypothetical protein EVJ58_g956 [Rhodofomes roseus]